ncbi:bifunctional hydroxymethylpyrimidine kinase/phosphomethylpyrimidine kinase [Pseudoscardovia suis]|uniref:Bifunctional hydroxymethylpyrimidine kinase/phosphomethylpyrimidine kinase n=2 Tax=Pseudoscardovia suis TaxID=987063 RepID=A0A261EX55_9BIFI|nr:bifunctional hydroxymethylpyrimidine kinase/phosphomethylpyrimidine kinase [Pseudoscardovia suis]OZG51425.1 bifunctional hydroxymethylpyrimidine kinase/phosphomethylpyrimidine kinase [Pseudoscardovia suis]PJJ68692.1 hydroxymethylpyrimidine kinase/phosphomethylpyrimidine kinase [Pseudoscardovia suis]
MNAAEEAVREALMESGFEFHHKMQSAQPHAHATNVHTANTTNAQEARSAMNAATAQSPTAPSQPAVPAPTLPAAAVDAVKATSEPASPAQQTHQSPRSLAASSTLPLVNGDHSAYASRGTGSTSGTVRGRIARNYGSTAFISPSSGATSNVSYATHDSRSSFTSRSVSANGAYQPSNLAHGHVNQKPRVLAIAGTDPTGGAGILADMKSIMACGGYGMGVVTSVVAQNTCKVSGIWPQSAEAITAQLQAVSSDVSIDSIKIGMMGTADAINAVHEWLETTDFTRMGGLWRKSSHKIQNTGVITTPIVQRSQHSHAAQDSLNLPGSQPLLNPEGSTMTPETFATDSDGRPVAAYHGIKQRVSDKQRPWVVLDPVMISTSGTRLLDPAAEGALAELLTSGLIDVLTPNLPELASLVGQPVAQTWEEAVEQGTTLLGKLGGSTRIYVKTGHLENSTSRADAFIDACTMRAISRNPVVTRLPGVKIDTRNTHGTGCALSSALATFRPQCKDWLETAQRSKAWIRGTIKHADELGVGLGNGPINHSWNLVDSTPIEDVPHQDATSNVLRRGI